jgi:ATP-binding cassette, subfamily C (CFTR/MRP), member 1
MSSCADDSSGPYAGPHCRGGFDFSRLFEEIYLVLLPIAIFLAVVPFRLHALGRRLRFVNNGGIYYLKAVSCAPLPVSWAISY